MQLDVKKPEQIVPSYSLTGDLVSYRVCPLNYRLHNGSSLPPSRPVQLWFGQFIHGVIELAYNQWSNDHESFIFPCQCTIRDLGSNSQDLDYNDVGKLGNIVELSLLQQGIKSRNRKVRESAYKRIHTAINLLGPSLFPQIYAAEKKVISSREIIQKGIGLRCEQYEIHGIIDVLTKMSLDSEIENNIILDAITEVCNISGENDFEIIVDYKGTPRPNVSDQAWILGEQQINTYAWLRSRQPESLEVKAGLIIYINELTPGDREMANLKKGIRYKDTDIIPETSSSDIQAIRMWRQGNSTNQLSSGFKLKRAFRVIPITSNSIEDSLSFFDQTVLDIEKKIVDELNNGNVITSWFPNCISEETCSACDWRYFCPRPFGKDSNYIPSEPPATID